MTLGSPLLVLDNLSKLAGTTCPSAVVDCDRHIRRRSFDLALAVKLMVSFDGRCGARSLMRDRNVCSEPRNPARRAHRQHDGRSRVDEATTFHGDQQGDRRREMPEIPVGANGAFTLVVAPEYLANRFKDSILPPVLATPLMILAMENPALNAIRNYLEPGETALGTAVNIPHNTGTPVVQRVTDAAGVIQTEDRQLVL